MGRKFYIADTHFGHRNIIQFDNRPYQDIEEMHHVMEMLWNSVVCDDDDVYILGDFSMHMNGERASALAGKLNGRKHLILGNHDKQNAAWYPARFSDVCRYAETDDAVHVKKVRVCMSHYFIPFYNRARYGAFMLHGHTHQTGESAIEEQMKQGIRNSGIRCEAFNVGCMWQNYMPQTLEQIIARQGRRVEVF